MKKVLFISLFLGVNVFSNYFIINYKGKNYRARENNNDVYTMVELNKYKRTLLNKYTQKYTRVRRMTDEEINSFNCSSVYNKCK